jgi:hypothetical protein
MVDRSGRVKIIDFGIAKAKTDPNLTVAGSSCGTPTYMPPEQFNPTEDIDYALVDIYAVGTTLFKMLTGELPFTGENQFALRDAKMFNDPPSPRNLNPEISKQLEEIILRSLAKAPSQRYSSASEMARALGTVREEDRVADPTESIPTREPSPAGPPGHRFPKIIFSVGFAVVALAVVIYVVFFRPPGTTVLKPPIQISPEDGEIIQSPIPTFSWQSVDEEGVAYIIEYSAESTFISPIEKPMVAATGYTAAGALANGRYFWRVQTQDNHGNRSPASPIRTFVIESEEAPPLQATLHISVQPRGDVFIDGRSFGRDKSVVTATVDTGSHVIRVVNSASEQGELSRTVYITADETQQVPFRFTFEATPAPPDTGELVVGSLPTVGGTIFIDGKKMDVQTPNTFWLPAGEHTVKVILKVDGELRELTDILTITGGEKIKKKFDFEQTAVTDLKRHDGSPSPFLQGVDNVYQIPDLQGSFRRDDHVRGSDLLQSIRLWPGG